MPILGTCINDKCDEPIPMFGETKDGRIAYMPHICEKCKTRMWTVVSRINPQTFEATEFSKRFIVNNETKNVEPMPGYDHYGDPI